MILTLMQCATIEWLWRYPDLSVSKLGFNGAWSDQKEHDDGNRAMECLGLRFSDPEHGGNLTGGGTPKTTRATIESLISSDLLTSDIEQRYGSYPDQIHYRPSRKGLEAYLRDRGRHSGKTAQVWGERKSNPRPVGLTEIRRRGGPESAKRYMESHRRLEAHHKRSADHLEVSLSEWDKHVESEQEKWRSGGAA